MVQVGLILVATCITPRTNAMKIELKQPYKSISTLTTEELPDFAILIGRNGVGKTQLLGALKEGQAVIPAIGVGEMELYDMDSFRPPNTNEADRNTSQFARDTANAYLMSSPGEQPLIETAAAIFDEFARDIECNSGVQARNDFESNLRDEVRHSPYGVLPLIHRTTACGRSAEEARGCASESGIMVLKQKTDPRKGAPNRCYHATTPTASTSPSTTTAWWPMPG